MDDISDRESFTFTWRIQHFNFCPQAIGQRINSPIFVVHFLNKSEWRLFIYPRGDLEHENSFGLFLQRTGDYTDEINFVLTMLSITGKEIKHSFENRAITKDYGLGSFEFCTWKDILNTSNGYLPNDTLTVKCDIWKIANGNNDDDEVQDNVRLATGGRRNKTLLFRTQFGCDQCTAVTSIEIGNKSILFPIRKFSEFGLKKELSISLPTSLKTDPSFFMTLYLNEAHSADQTVKIEIRINFNGNEQNYYVKCKIVAFHPSNTYRCAKEDEHLFVTDTEDDVWKFPEFINIQKFKNVECLNSSQDILHIRCEFAFTRSEAVSHVEETAIVDVTSESPLFKFNNPIGPLFKQLYNSDKLSDVIIRTGDHDFKAHKVVLAAQSTVFKAMFENDMEETRKGVVDIKDIEQNILDSMLHFMYGNDLKITNQVDAEKLYSAADKYNFLQLKCLCSCFLKSNLSVSNVCSVLTLADWHQDEDLMEEIKTFIRFHATDVFHSLTWNKFMGSNSKLASDIMLTMLQSLSLMQ